MNTTSDQQLTNPVAGLPVRLPDNIQQSVNQGQVAEVAKELQATFPSWSWLDCYQTARKLTNAKP